MTAGSDRSPGACLLKAAASAAHRFTVEDDISLLRILDVSTWMAGGVPPGPAHHE